MSIAAWILIGLAAGLIGSRFHRQVRGKSRVSASVQVSLGIIGAVVAGWIFNGITTTVVAGFNVYSLLAAVVGSVVLILVCRPLLRPTRYRRQVRDPIFSKRLK